MESSQLQLARVRSALLASAGIEDCAVVARNTVLGAAEIVAYVAGPGALARRELVAAVAGVGKEVSLVPVSAIPLTMDGDPDFELLRGFPVLDEHSLREWERQPGMGEASLKVRLRQIQIGEEHWGSGTPAKASIRSEIGAVGSGAPAVTHGPLLDTEDLPRNLPEVLRRNIERNPNHWLVCFRSDGSEVRMRWLELAQQAERVLGGLRARGIRPGERVVLECRELDETLLAFWACQIGGLVAIPVATVSASSGDSGGAAKLQGICRLVRPSLIIGSSDSSKATEVVGLDDLIRAEPDSRWHESDPDAVALILFTSGSTGTPKGVQHTPRTLISHAAANTQVHGFTSNEVQVNWFPLDHIGGIEMAHLQGAFLGDCQVHVPSEQILRDPLAWIDLADRFGATWTWAPNFAFGLVNDRVQELQRAGVFDRKWDISRLGFVLNGGEAVVAKTARTFLRLLGPFGLRPDAMRPAWGMSETCSGIAFSRGIRPDCDDAPFVEVGLPVAGISMRIIGPDESVALEGESGRLQVQGCSITPGYFENPEANTASFTADGWFETGDLASLAEGRLTITGRSKDVVIINGVNVHSHEVEAAVDELPGVDLSFTAACGVRETGDQTDRLCIFFHPVDSDSARLTGVVRRIRAKVYERTGAVPQFVIPVERDEIPKTNIGKIQRAQLKADFEAGRFRERSIRESGLQRTGIYEVKWVPSRVAEPGELRGRRFLICGDAPGLTEDLRQRLEQVHARCAIAAAGSDLSIEIERERPDTIVHLGCFESILAMLNILAGQAKACDLRICIANSGGAEPVAERGAIAGLLRSFAAGTGIRCSQVNVAVNAGKAAYQIVRELASDGVAAHASWRENERFVQALSPIVPGQTEGIRQGGFYLVTGGLGGVGLHLSRYLMERHGARLLVTGRRNASQCGAEISELGRSGGEFVYETADTVNLEAMEHLIAEAEAKWGRSLDGIFHLAGALGDDGGTAMDDFVPLLRTKAHGAAVLGEVVRKRPDARLVLFSSVNAVFGSGSLWAYSAANSAMDLVAEHLAQTGVRAQSINWSMWEGAGMSERTTAASREASLAIGYQSLTPEHAIEALEICLSLDATRVIVGLDGSNPRIRPLVRGNAQPLEELVLHAREGSMMPSNVLRDRFGTSAEWVATAEDEGEEEPAELPAGKVEEGIAAMIGELLRVQRIGRHDSFFVLGGDSLAAMRLLNRVEEHWGVRIALRSMAENATVAGLAALLDDAVKPSTTREHDALGAEPERLLADLDTFDDAQVEALLARFAVAGD